MADKRGAGAHLELADVSVLLHDLQELDDDLGGGAQEDLALASLLSVGDRLQGVGQNGHAHHCGEGNAVIGTR